MDTFGNTGYMINDVVTGSRMEWLECPSCGAAGEGPSSFYPGNYQYFYMRRTAYRTSYLFATGTMTDYSVPHRVYQSNIRQGTFGNDGAQTMAGVTDGLSNTIAIGEACGGSNKTSTHYGPWGLDGLHTCCHMYVVSYSSSRAYRAGSRPLKFCTG